MLIVMAGLPGAGKSAVAGALARALPAPVIAVDVIEAAMWNAGIAQSQPTGLAAYVVAEAIAEGFLIHESWVIIDAVNAVEPARQQWRSLANRLSVPLRFIEVICADAGLHRRRLEERTRDLPRAMEPSWDAVVRRRAAYESWTDDRLVLDTVAALDQNVATALAYLNGG